VLEAALGLLGSWALGLLGSWAEIVTGVDERVGIRIKNDQNKFLSSKTCGIDRSLVRAPRVLAPPEGETPRARGVRLIVGPASDRAGSAVQTDTPYFSSNGCSGAGSRGFAKTGSFRPRDAYTSSVKRAQASGFSFMKRRAFSRPWPMRSPP